MSVLNTTLHPNPTHQPFADHSPDVVDGCLSGRSTPMATNGCSPLHAVISSPLEVLSSAAALVEKTTPYDRLDAKFGKELPRKGHKMKRNRSRRELAHSCSFRLNTRSSSPPTDDLMLANRAEHSLSPNFSPAPIGFSRASDTSDSTSSANNFSTALSLTSTYAGLGLRPSADANGLLSNYRGSPYQSVDSTTTTVRRDSDHSTQSSTADSTEDEDKPLDMSNKKYRNSESQSPKSSGQSEPMSLSQSPTNGWSNGCAQQMRPSVITCAPSLKSQTREQWAPQQSVQSLSLSPTNCQNCCTTVPNEANACRRHRSLAASGRQVIVADEASDPVIDEHFRRSLGKDYSQIFSNSANNNSITYSVDDHFAKALGDTWVRLQKTANRLAVDDSPQANSAQSITS